MYQVAVVVMGTKMCKGWFLPSCTLKFGSDER